MRIWCALDRARDHPGGPTRANVGVGTGYGVNISPPGVFRGRCRFSGAASKDTSGTRGLPALWRSRLISVCMRRTIIPMTAHTPFPTAHTTREPVAFHRTELSVILTLYGRMVSAGEWRDYGISHLPEVAVFSIFRRTAEHPLYRIEKRPKLRDKRQQYSVIGMDGRILKRGDDLRTVLRVLERKLIRAVE